MRVPAEALQEALEGFFRKLGLTPQDASAFAEVLVEAELEGISSHGLSRVPIYAAQLREGGLNPRPKLRFERPRPGVAVLHADRAPGPVAALRAVEAAQALAREVGVGAVALRGAGHVGPLSAYVRRLARAGLVGLAFANTPPALFPGPVLGTNPIALGAPLEPEPVVVDLSLSVAARGKILQAAHKDEAIPEGWAVDREGRSTTDPKAALEGALLPVGGAKGYALAVLVEVLAGVLAGEVLSPELPLPWKAPGKGSTPGLLLLVMEPVAFGKGFGERMQRLAKSLEAAGGRLPGARRAEARWRWMREGVEIPDELIQDLAELGLAFVEKAC